MKKLFLLLMLFFASSTLANAYTDLQQDFWAYDKIQSLTEEGILKGYPDGTFKPENNVTRAEFATMVINGLYQQDAKITEKINFTDLPETYWAYERIQQAVSFDLIKGTPENYFYPEDFVTRAHTISVAVNALNTRNITEQKAKEVLNKAYKDYDKIPSWVIVNAGKAEILGMNVKVPNSEDIFSAEKYATRAEAAVAVYNMVQQAKLNPNEKLAEAMRPKKGEGIIIDSAEYIGSTITIPAGTKLPIVLIDDISSQTNKVGELFIAKVPQNYITKEKYIIIVENSPIAGQILDVKIGRYFIRNGKLTLETKKIRTLNRNQEAAMTALVDTTVKRGFWARLARAIFKGAKVNFDGGQQVEITLLKPLKIDAINGRIIE